jgi:predicted ATPase/DNA-binding SARP family transcriptional activator/Tfp pilus assembly protein PilF
LQDLRQTLVRLRTAIGDRARPGDRARSGDCARPGEARSSYLLVDSQSIQFNRESDYSLDVDAFEELVSGTNGHRHRRLDACPACISRLSEAAQIYRGEFLAGLHPAAGPALDEWLLIQREQLQQRACVMLHALASAHLARGDGSATRNYSGSWLRLDPWNEAAERLMLRALSMEEGRNAALHQYQAFRADLLHELGVEPEDETLSLVDEIRSGAPAGMEPHLPLGTLPTPATPFVGREEELACIAGYLAGQDQRLITLYGPGGSGKTRLALEVAAVQAPLWQDGVWFVRLTGVPAAQALVETLATALDLRAGSDSMQVVHLLDFLSTRELLLVLDSFEHLLDCSDLLRDMLRSAPLVKVLVTSRARLGLPEEWAIQVLGLEVPPEPQPVLSRTEEPASVQLFLNSAQRVAPTFDLSPENLSHVARICRRVAGLPLGIELAAAWARLIPCQQIAAEMEESLDFLQNLDGSTAGRHRSLRATFEYSYRLLPEAQQAQFRKLSIFRGGCSPQGAHRVAGIEPGALICLADRSLLQISPNRRLEMHATLREYATEKLAEHPEEEAALREHHGRFYLSFLRAKENALKGETPQRAKAEIDSELGNVREAWKWAVDRADAEEVGASVAALSRYYDLKGLIREAESAFGSAAWQLLALDGTQEGTERVAHRLLTEQARFLLHGADYSQAAEVARTAAAQACSTGDRLCDATLRYILGEALWRQGDYPAARVELERCLDLLREEQAAGTAIRAAREIETWALGSLGAASWIHGDCEEGRAYLERALHIAQEDNDVRERSKLLTNLGVCAVEQGNYAQANELLQQSLLIRQTMGDRRGEGITLGNLGNVFLYLGAYAQAKAYYERALHMQREIGARNDEALSLGNLGLVHHYLGQNATARALCRDALQIGKETGEKRTVGALWMKMGHALEGLGQHSRAKAAYQESVDLRRKQGWHDVAMEPLAGLAQVALVQGDLELAQECAEEIWDHLQTGTLAGTVSPFQVYLTTYLVLKQSGDSRAGQVLEAAHEDLLERSARIADTEMQHSFLHNVQPHREIIREYALLMDTGKSSSPPILPSSP